MIEMVSWESIMYLLVTIESYIIARGKNVKEASIRGRS